MSYRRDHAESAPRPSAPWFAERSIGLTDRTKDAGPARWFVMQGFDPITGSPFVEMRFHVADIAVLQAIVRDGDDHDLAHSYVLTEEEHDAIEHRFGVALDCSDCEVILAPWQSIREAPYLIHTGFELPLMMEGRKPLTVLSDTYPGDWFEALIAQFNALVLDGRLIGRIVDRPFEAPYRLPDGAQVDGIREAYFAQPGQEWRIDAYLLLRQVGEKAGWSDALERYQGSLLGYEDWQNDWWFSRRSG
jgi:hypothetical protein